MSILKVQLIDDFINTLRTNSKSVEISRTKGLEKVISTLHQIQINPTEKYSDIIKKSSKLLNEYENLDSQNNEIKRKLDVREKESKAGMTEWEVEIEKRQKIIVQLRTKRNEIIHSYRREVEVLDRHITAERRFSFEQITLQEQELLLKTDNYNWLAGRDFESMKVMELFYLNQKEKDTQVLEKWVDDYEEKISEQENDMEVLKTGRAQIISELEHAKLTFQNMEQVVNDHNLELKRREEAKKLIEMQVTAILLLQRWWRKLHKPEPKKAAKKKVAKKVK